MNNRLGDLPDWANEPDDDEEDGDEKGYTPGADIEKGRGKTKEEVDKEIFFTAVEQIKGEIGHIILATADIEKINEQAQKATTTEKEQDLSRRLRKTIDTTNKQAKAAKNLLGELKAENEQLKLKGEIKASDLRWEMQPLGIVELAHVFVALLGSRLLVLTPIKTHHHQYHYTFRSWK